MAYVSALSKGGKAVRNRLLSTSKEQRRRLRTVFPFVVATRGFFRARVSTCDWKETRGRWGEKKIPARILLAMAGPGPYQSFSSKTSFLVNDKATTGIAKVLFDLNGFLLTLRLILVPNDHRCGMVKERATTLNLAFDLFGFECKRLSMVVGIEVVRIRLVRILRQEGEPVIGLHLKFARARFDCADRIGLIQADEAIRIPVLEGNVMKNLRDT
jgi:hypothetical protein